MVQYTTVENKSYLLLENCCCKRLTVLQQFCCCNGSLITKSNPIHSFNTSLLCQNINIVYVKFFEVYSFSGCHKCNIFMVLFLSITCPLKYFYILWLCILTMCDCTCDVTHSIMHYFKQLLIKQSMCDISKLLLDILQSITMAIQIEMKV